jgi:hypothetical protein
MVVVHVQNGDPRHAGSAQMLRGQRRIVQKAITPKKIGTGVVARRAAECKRSAITI